MSTLYYNFIFVFSIHVHFDIVIGGINAQRKEKERKLEMVNKKYRYEISILISIVDYYRILGLYLINSLLSIDSVL